MDIKTAKGYKETTTLNARELSIADKMNREFMSNSYIYNVLKDKEITLTITMSSGKMHSYSAGRDYMRIILENINEGTDKNNGFWFGNVFIIYKHIESVKLI